MKTIKVGMIGFGGIARLHKAAYDAISEKCAVKLAAVCDTSMEQFIKKSAINISAGENADVMDFNKYTNSADMIASEELDLIDICVPTPFHSAIACEMLSKGYNVLSEKPMARTYAQCLDMLNAKKASGKTLMIGQCVRFIPEYAFLKDLCVSGKYGRARTAYFYRLSSPPTWGFKNWLLEPEKSGGCLLDMHIHDLDFSRYLFGEPEKVSCSSTSINAKYDTIQSRLFYDGLTVEATGDWGLSPKYVFSAGYRVNFETATVEFKDGTVTVYPYESAPFVPEIEKSDYFRNEISYLLGVLRGEYENTVNPPESAAESVRLTEVLRESADNGSAIMKF